MLWLRLLILCPLVTLLICQSYSPVYAQADDGFAKHRQEIANRNPEGLSFTLKLKDGQRQFHVGEKIRLELSFSSNVPDVYVFERANYDRSGRLEIDSFVFDQTNSVRDPLLDYFHGSLGHSMGGLRGIDALTTKPELVAYDLNEWLRFDKPGKYRLYVISHRLTKGKPHHEGNLALEPVSNIVEFEIVPANPEWEQTTLAAALKTLNEPNRPNFSVGESERQSACRVLRFLGSESAIKEMTARLRGEDQQCDFEYYLGLIDATNRRFAREQMEAAIDRPTQPVSSTFLNALVQIATAERNVDDWQTFANDEAGKQAAQAQWQRWRANYDLTIHAYADRLANAIPRKERTAAAISLQTLVNLPANDQAADSGELKQSLLVSLTKVFLDLPPESQRNMLESNWTQISDPVMLPVLRQLYEHPPHLNESPQPFPGIALRRIYELAPPEGRQLILDEMRRPKLRVDLSELTLLPDKELPELEDTIVTRAIEQKDENSIGLIPRYVSASSLPRLRAAFENRIGRMACLEQGDLIAYFLRVAPDFGMEMIRKAIRSTKETHCYPSVLGDALGDSMSADFEKLALDALDDDDPEMVYSAVGVLCRQGSAANKPKIKAAIARVINQWRKAKLDPEAMTSGDEGYYPGYFAESLLHIYVMAIPWVTPPDEIQELTELCLTSQCRRQLKPQDLLADTSIRFYYSEGARNQSNIAVGQYEGLSFHQLKQKVIQFPKGTKFTWSLSNAPKDIDQSKFDEVRAYLKDQGFELVRFEPQKQEQR